MLFYEWLISEISFLTNPKEKLLKCEIALRVRFTHWFEFLFLKVKALHEFEDKIRVGELKPDV